MTHQPDRPISRRPGTAELRRQNGVETVEVALIGALIVVILLVAVPVLTPGITEAFNDVTDALQNAEAQLE